MVCVRMLLQIMMGMMVNTTFRPCRIPSTENVKIHQCQIGFSEEKKQGVHQEHQKVQAPETHDRTERQPEVQPAAEKQRQHKDENRGIAEGGIRRDHGCGEQKKTEELCPGIETVQEALPRKILTGQTAAHSLSPPIIRSTAGRSSE